MLHLKKCFCYSLETGVKIISILGILSGVTAILQFLVLYQNAIEFDDVISGQIANIEKLQEDGEISKQVLQVWKTVFVWIRDVGLPYTRILDLAFGIVEIIVNSCLLYGLTKRKAAAFWPYLIVKILENIAVIIGATLVVVFFFGQGFVALGIIFTLALVLCSSLGIYIWLVVKSLQDDIKKGNTEYEYQLT